VAILCRFPSNIEPEFSLNARDRESGCPLELDAILWLKVPRKSLSKWAHSNSKINSHPIAMRMDVVPGFRKAMLTTWAQRPLVPGTAVVSDGLKCFPGVTDADCTHTAISTGGGVPDLGHPIFWWVNTMLGNVKNALHGTYHALRPKYLQRYLSEFCYRFNRRFDLAALVTRLIVASVRTPPLSYRLVTLDA
jgi:hypothetical protein